MAKKPKAQPAAEAAPTAPAAPAPAAPAKPEKAPKAPKPEVVKEPEQNGVRRPAAGGKTRVPWDIADRVSAEVRRPATRKEVVDAAIAAGCNPSMAQSQYARWRKFHGIEGRVAAPAPAAPATPAPAAPTGDSGEVVPGSSTSKFDEGYDAYAKGTPATGNPYTEGTNEAESWSKGWNQADTDAT